MKKSYLPFICMIFIIWTLSACTKEATPISENQKADIQIAQPTVVQPIPEAIPVVPIEASGTEIKNDTWATSTIIAPPSIEDIKLAWCDTINDIWWVKWCMKNTKVTKTVEWYKDVASKSIQEDSWYRGIYTNDSDDVFYTFEYLWKACWLTEDEWINSSWHESPNCPCPIGYHIPTSKDWKDTIGFFKNNPIPLIDELKLKPAWYRRSKWTYLGYAEYTYLSNMNNSDGTIVIPLLGGIGYQLGLTDALPLRCAKDN